MINKILNNYEEYKLFMDLQGQTLPKLIPIIETDNMLPTFAYVNADEITSEKVNIYCSPKLFIYPKRFQKSKLFHEFTHILDYLNLSTKYNEDELYKILSTYSEYHASQIELACNIGFKNIHTLHKINLDKTYVATEEGIALIENDYIKPIADALVIINKTVDAYLDLSCEKYYTYFKKFEANTMYYLGKQNFCSKFSIKQIPNITQQNYMDFYPCLSSIENSIKNKEFDKLPSLEKLLFKKFYEKYPNNDFKVLIKEFPGMYI